MGMEFGYINKDTNVVKVVKYKPQHYCDLYVNQGKTCPIVEKIKSTTERIIPLGGAEAMIINLCMRCCIHFLKRDMAQLATNAGL